MAAELRLGLRVDVDTYRGTREGVPRLLRILNRHGAIATFFFSVGPDNMGRHLLSLRHPAFLAKMWRTRAARLYGWSILFRGLLTSGPLIGRRLSPIIREAAADGHEIGLHAWDHFGWQSAALGRGGAGFVREDLRRGVEELRQITGRFPVCSAAPAWLGTPEALECKAEYPFRYNSDCRGESVFRPVLTHSAVASQPQIPTTLPVYDEVIGREVPSDDDYNRFLMTQLRPDRLNVLTIHAEVEGIACRELFDRLLREFQQRGVSVVSLGVIAEETQAIPEGHIELAPRPGRQGVVAVQVSAEKTHAIHGAR